MMMYHSYGCFQESMQRQERYVGVYINFHLKTKNENVNAQILLQLSKDSDTFSYACFNSE